MGLGQCYCSVFPSLYPVSPSPSLPPSLTAVCYVRSALCHSCLPGRPLLHSEDASGRGPAHHHQRTNAPDKEITIAIVISHSRRFHRYLYSCSLGLGLAFITMSVLQVVNDNGITINHSNLFLYCMPHLDGWVDGCVPCIVAFTCSANVSNKC